MKFLLGYGLLFLLSFTANQSIAAEKRVSYKSSTNGFYDKKEQGWFWFNEEIEPEPEEKKEVPLAPPVPASKTEPNQVNESKNSGTTTVIINAAWLRENLPKLRETAIDNPSKENMAAYYYAQRMTIDLASRFADRTKAFFAEEPMLDERSRRPVDSFAINANKESTKAAKEATLRKLFKDTGIWVFVRSDCSYCKAQIPVIDELQRVYGVDVLYISVDGAPIPGHTNANYEYDVSGHVRKTINLEATLTPSIVLVNSTHKSSALLNEGMISLSEILNKTLLIAKSHNWLSEVDYNNTQEVKNITTLDDNNVIEVTSDSESANDVGESLIKTLKNKLRNRTNATASRPEEEK